MSVALARCEVCHRQWRVQASVPLVKARALGCLEAMGLASRSDISLGKWAVSMCLPEICSRVPNHFPFYVSIWILKWKSSKGKRVLSDEIARFRGEPQCRQLLFLFRKVLWIEHRASHILD